MAPAPAGAPIRGSSVETKTKFSEVAEKVPPLPTPPGQVYPCGCAYPGPHAPDCMWSLWEQMRDNYNQTKTLMGKFMLQVDAIQSPVGSGACQCKCPLGCHGQDLGEAVGLQQLTGVTVPFRVPRSPVAREASRLAMAPGYLVESEARRQMEEQRHIKGTWAQFLNIFDMSLDLANDVSKDRQEAKRRRKERAKLEGEQRLGEAHRERQERFSEAKQRAADTAAQKQEKEDTKEKEKGKKSKEEEKPTEKEQPTPKQEPQPEREPATKPQPETEPEPKPEPEEATPQPKERTPTEDQETSEPTADEEKNAETEVTQRATE